MSVFPLAHSSKIYTDFKKISPTAFQKIVDFYKVFEEEIQHMKFDEFFEVQIAYIDALFEVESYKKMVPVCNKTIESVIIHDVRFYKGEDIYRKLLVKKAAAHYHLMEYHKARYVLAELIKINPEDKKSLWMLKKCQHFLPPFYVQYTRNFGLFLFFLTAIVIGIEIIFFGTGTNSTPWESFAAVSRNVLFLSGWIVLLLGDGIYRFKVFRSTKKFVKKAKKAKLRATSYRSKVTSRI